MRVYVVSDHGNVIYVGLAKNTTVGERLAKHMENSVSNRKKSLFANLMFQSHPSYFEWDVLIYTLQECMLLTSIELVCLEQAECAVYDYYKVLQGKAPIGNKARPSCMPKA
jgi:hypothetical protein